MDTLSSPLRLAPPSTPRRAPSPTMSPGGRRARGTEERGLRNLSPDTTLRAFSERPLPFDTTQDEYKIFACIETLTAAERDLGTRVAKAAQRLKSWCEEIEQWGWSNSFEQPSAKFREQRRRSLELRIREHIPDADMGKTLQPLEYWGSLLSDEVKHHEARLDDIADEMLALDIEELKEHLMDMYPAGRSRPSSAGMDADRKNYILMDDFSFLITQTLISALPDHQRVKERLNTWHARVSILREVPRYLADLEDAQRAMQAGWEAIKPPVDSSDIAFVEWKEAVVTIQQVLQTKVGTLGRKLDTMLDTLEGRDDSLPDGWIDTFEAIESDFGHWTQESRTRAIIYDLQRGRGQQAQKGVIKSTKQSDPHSNGHKSSITTTGNSPALQSNGETHDAQSASIVSRNLPGDEKDLATPVKSPLSRDVTPLSTPRSKANRPTWFLSPTAKSFAASSVVSPTEALNEDSTNETRSPDNKALSPREQVDGAQPNSSTAQQVAVPIRIVDDPVPQPDVATRDVISDPAHGHVEDESEFEEGDTVIHNELEDSPSGHTPVQADVQRISDHLMEEDKENTPSDESTPLKLRAIDRRPVIITDNVDESAADNAPQTPRLRRASVDSLSSERSFETSPPSFIEDSPSVRNAPDRPVRAPRPELNAAMSKRRSAKAVTDEPIASAPWPPTRFANNSVEDLERKISDILTTIPAHIRLTSGPSKDSPEVKPRSVSTKSSRGFLRAARSINGLKSPELTLSPAKSDFDAAAIASGRKSAALRVDNDIKLYHLTQPGKEHPIKLFIRRVGENGERVMVRVGGGWADLGEYLRQYAEHHGRRTVSDGKFEILGLEVKNSDHSPPRPESSMSKRDRRFSGNHQSGSPTSTPVKSPNFANGKADTTQPMSGLASTPIIAEEASTPSTTSSQRSWRGDEVGLAGPKARKLDLSGEKLEWIEGMMKQARTVSGNLASPATLTPTTREREERVESRSESRSASRSERRSIGGTGAATKKPEFGDLGKVGGTKRIFLRGGKPHVSED